MKDVLDRMAVELSPAMNCVDCPYPTRLLCVAASRAGNTAKLKFVCPLCGDGRNLPYPIDDFLTYSEALRGL